MANKTLQELTDRVYYNLGVPEDHPSAPLETVQDIVNEIEFRILKGMKFPFMKDKKLFRTIQDVTLSADITTASTEITVPTGFISSSESYMIINHDVIKYTGVTTGATDTLTGVTGIDISHDSGDSVRQLFTVPTTFSHQPRLQIGSREWEYVLNMTGSYERFMTRRFTIHNESGVELLELNGSPSNVVAEFSFYKKGGTMVNFNDECALPDQWSIIVIPEIATSVIRRSKMQENRSILIARAAKEVQQEMNKYYGSRNAGQKPRVTFGLYGSRKNI